jgi:hypothetical protein
MTVRAIGLITDAQWRALAVRALDTADPYWRNLKKDRREKAVEEMIADLKTAVV